MSHRALSVLFVLAALAGTTPGPRALTAASSCEELAALVIPGVTIESAKSVAAGPFAPSAGSRPVTVSTFCRVTAVAAPSADSHIAIEVWIPAAEGWNGKLLGTANGGFAGS